MTLKQVKALKLGDILHHNNKKEKDGSCQKWKVISGPKAYNYLNLKTTHKNKSAKFYVGLQHEKEQFAYLTELWLHLYHLPNKCTNSNKGSE
jgi:hypothetical protein